MLPEQNSNLRPELRLRNLCKPFGATLRVVDDTWIEVYRGDKLILLLNADEVTEETFLADLLWAAYERGRAQGKKQLQQDLGDLLRPDPNVAPGPTTYD